MEKMLNSFMNENMDTFVRIFDRHKTKKLYNREDYANLRKRKNEIYSRYPKIREFIENKMPMNFEIQETEAFYELVTIFDMMNDLDMFEAYKLGAKEAYIFFEEMDMLNI